MKAKNFLINTAQGAVIGVAMIIPGVSGGTLAVLMNVYDKLINSISNLRRDFKNSIKFLLPILLGAGIAVAAMYFPLKYALKYAPFPTVMLFAGLMAGSFPKIVKDGLKQGFQRCFPSNTACRRYRNLFYPEYGKRRPFLRYALVRLFTLNTCRYACELCARYPRSERFYAPAHFRILQRDFRYRFSVKNKFRTFAFSACNVCARNYYRLFQYS